MTTPKLPPPPRIAQNRSGFSVALARQHVAIGGDDVGRQQVVDGQAELAGQPAEAAAQRQPGDAGGRVDAGRRGQAERLRLAVDVAQGARRARPRRAARAGSTRTDFMRERSIISPPSQTALAGDVVAAAAHRDQQRRARGRSAPPG